jgi:hypothetical protein
LASLPANPRRRAKLSAGRIVALFGHEKEVDGLGDELPGFGAVEAGKVGLVPQLGRGQPPQAAVHESVDQESAGCGTRHALAGVRVVPSPLPGRGNDPTFNSGLLIEIEAAL